VEKALTCIDGSNRRKSCSVPVSSTSNQVRASMELTPGLRDQIWLLKFVAIETEVGHIACHFHCLMSSVEGPW
jgi:hypothetical protein